MPACQLWRSWIAPKPIRFCLLLIHKTADFIASDLWCGSVTFWECNTQAGSTPRAWCQLLVVLQTEANRHIQIFTVPKITRFQRRQRRANSVSTSSSSPSLLTCFLCKYLRLSPICWKQAKKSDCHLPVIHISLLPIFQDRCGLKERVIKW